MRYTVGLKERESEREGGREKDIVRERGREKVRQCERGRESMFMFLCACDRSRKPPPTFLPPLYFFFP